MLNIKNAPNLKIDSSKINPDNLNYKDYISDQFNHHSSSIFPKSLEFLLSNFPDWFLIFKNITIYIFCLLLIIALFRSIWGRRAITTLTTDTKITFLIYSFFIYFTSWGALNSAVLNAQGAIDNFWILPYFLLSFCSIGSFDIARNLKIGKWKVSSFIALFASIIVGISSLEFTIALLLFHTALVIFFLYQNFSKWAVRHLIVVFFTTISFLVQIISPGNLLDYAKNVNEYMPNINEVSFILKLELNFRWLADSLINQSGILFLALSLINAVLFFDINKNLNEIAVFNKIDEMMKGENRRHKDNKKEENEVANLSLKDLNMTKTTVVRIENIEQQVENKQLRNIIFAVLNIILFILLLLQKITRYVDFNVVWNNQTAEAGLKTVIFIAILIPIFIIFSNSLLYQKERKQNKKFIVLVFGLAYFATFFANFFNPLMFSDNFESVIFVPNILLTFLIMFNVPLFSTALINSSTNKSKI